MLQHHLLESGFLCLGKQRFVCQNTVAWKEKNKNRVLLTTTAALEKDVIMKILKPGMVIAQLVK